MDGIEYHDVTWAALADLKYPVAKPLRKNWTADQIAEITPFEGVAVRTTGYLVAFKPPGTRRAVARVQIAISRLAPTRTRTWHWLKTSGKRRRHR